MTETGLDQIKCHIPKELKAKFTDKVRKENKTQTGVLKSLIHLYLKP